MTTSCCVVFLAFTLSFVSFALSLCLALVLDGLLEGACEDLAILLTTGTGCGCASSGASVHFKSIRFLLISVPFSV